MQDIFRILGRAFASFRDGVSAKEPLPKNEIEAYRRRIRNHRRAVYIRAALIVVVLAAAALIAYRIYDKRSYSSYEVVKAEASADNISNYRYIKGKILRYSADGASLLKTVKSDLEAQWNVSYNMTQPCVDVFDKTILIYDRRGSDIYVYDDKGKVGSFATEMPILYACCSGAGNVACALENGNGMEIAYYSAEGSLIAAVSEPVEKTGYPVAMALSENGKKLIVSYVTTANGAVSTNLLFYNFQNSDRSGKDKTDANINFSGVVIPDIKFVDNHVAAVYRDNGISFYNVSGKPIQTSSVDVDNEIVSTFTGDRFAGLVFRNRNSSKPYRMEIYTENGKLVSQTDMEIVYDRIGVCGNEILFSNSSEAAVYTKSGACRFCGIIDEGNLQDVQKLGRKTLLVVTDMSTNIVELK